MGAAVPIEIQRAVDALRAGRLVALPTETVYGLAADATNATAVRRVFEVKGRPAGHPLIVHLGAASRLSNVAATPSGAALAIGEAFWPGPVTVVVARRSGSVAAEVSGGRDTLAVRVPDHPAALAVLDSFDAPVVAPSANRFGRVSPTSAADVRRDLGDDVDVILDGGRCALGVESTIVDCTGKSPEVLRVGAVPVEELSSVLGQFVSVRADAEGAPGTLPAHYAPAASVVACEPESFESTVQELRAEGSAVGTIGADHVCGEAHVLGQPHDAAEYAHELYHWLRAADENELDVVVAVLPAGAGLAAAVRDRLRRASHARPYSDQ